LNIDELAAPTVRIKASPREVNFKFYVTLF